MSIIYQPMPQGAKLDLSMPEWVKLDIADSVILFGRLEQKVIEIAWDVAGSIEVKERLRRARQPAYDNFDEILAVIEQAAGTKFDALRLTFEALAKERNLIVHGSWLMADGKPYVVWHKFITDSDSVMGEFFEKGRFDYFKKRGSKLLETCKTWHDMLSEQQGKIQSALNRVPDSSSQQ
jgi:hypothetical protein